MGRHKISSTPSAAPPSQAKRCDCPGAIIDGAGGRTWRSLRALLIVAVPLKASTAVPLFHESSALMFCTGSAAHIILLEHQGRTAWGRACNMDLDVLGLQQAALKPIPWGLVATCPARRGSGLRESSMRLSLAVWEAAANAQSACGAPQKSLKCCRPYSAMAVRRQACTRSGEGLCRGLPCGSLAAPQETVSLPTSAGPGRPPGTSGTADAQIRLHGGPQGLPVAAQMCSAHRRLCHTLISWTLAGAATGAAACPHRAFTLAGEPLAAHLLRGWIGLASSARSRCCRSQTPQTLLSSGTSLATGQRCASWRPPSPGSPR